MLQAELFLIQMDYLHSVPLCSLLQLKLHPLLYCRQLILHHGDTLHLSFINICRALGRPNIAAPDTLICGTEYNSNYVELYYLCV